MKAAGGQYKPQKYKRKVYKEHGNELVGANKAKKDKGKDKDKKKQRDTPTWRPYDKVDVSAFSFSSSCCSLEEAFTVLLICKP